MKKVYTVFLFFFLHAMLNAQCPQRYLDKVFKKIHFKSSIGYGGNRLNMDGTRTWLASDLYEPDGDTAQLRPLVFLIHGGGFTNFPPLFRTSPDIVEMATDLAKRGYVVVSPEYRLFSGDNTYLKMIQTVMAASIDVNDAVCFFVNSVSQGNPYRIDTSKFFIGGNSAGAMLALNSGLFLDDTTQLDQNLRDVLRSVAAFDHRDPQDILQHKFCGAHLLGAIGVSGGLIDTNFVQYKEAHVLLIHGTNDPAVPWGAGNVYSDPNLPKIFGSGAIYDKIKRSGTEVEFDSYPGLGHVPIIWNFTADIPGAILNTITHGTIFNQPILDSTERHIARFCYKAIGSPETDCRLTGLTNIVAGQLRILPNPSSGNFLVEIPRELMNHKLTVQIQNLIGQTIFEQDLENSSNMYIDISGQQKGMYILRINYSVDGTSAVYTQKIIYQ